MPGASVTRSVCYATARILLFENGRQLTQQGCDWQRARDMSYIRRSETAVQAGYVQASCRQLPCPECMPATWSYWQYTSCTVAAAVDYLAGHCKQLLLCRSCGSCNHPKIYLRQCSAIVSSPRACVHVGLPVYERRTCTTEPAASISKAMHCLQQWGLDDPGRYKRA